MKLKTWTKNVRVKRSLMAGGAVLTLALGVTRWVSGPFFASSERYVEENVTDPFSSRPRRRFPLKLEAQSTISEAFQAQGLSVEDVNSMVRAAKPFMDLGRVRAGTRFGVEPLKGPQPASHVHLAISPIETLELNRQPDSSWKAELHREKVDIRLVSYKGIVSSSLWESAESSDMDPNLISELAEIFAWQVDFSREVHANDRWRLIVEEKLVQGEPIGWGNIVAAEYTNAGVNHQAVLFRDDGQNKGYFAPNGSSLRRMFLKSPLRFSRISSRFTMKRFHPVLGYNRPHLGVDYAAPMGTPIRSVGDGVVEVAGWRGGAGRMIKIRHNATYETAYKHLSAWAKGLKAGQRVSQGEIIGYVGSSGLSTGAHLHFEFYVRGRYVDPLGQQFPSADPVPKSHQEDFHNRSMALVASLPDWRTTAGATGRIIIAAETSRRLSRAIGSLAEPRASR